MIKKVVGLRDAGLLLFGGLGIFLFHDRLTGGVFEAAVTLFLFGLVGLGAGGLGERFLLWLTGLMRR